MDNPIEEIKPKKKDLIKKIKKGAKLLKIKKKTPLEIELDKFDGIIEHIQEWGDQELKYLSKNIMNLAKAKKPKKKWPTKMGFGTALQAKQAG